MQSTNRKQRLDDLFESIEQGLDIYHENTENISEKADNVYKSFMSWVAKSNQVKTC